MASYGPLPLLAVVERCAIFEASSHKAHMDRCEEYSCHGILVRTDDVDPGTNLCSVLGVAGEFIGERGHAWGVNNNQHLIIWGGFFTGGLVEFLAIFNYLKEPFWAYVNFFM